MKNYEAPVIEIEELCFNDAITSSYLNVPVKTEFTFSEDSSDMFFD